MLPRVRCWTQSTCSWSGGEPGPNDKSPTARRGKAPQGPISPLSPPARHSQQGCIGEGLLPAIVSQGEIVVGDGLAVRGVVARAELGAVFGGRLRLGDRVYINQGVSIVAQCSIAVGNDVRIGDLACVYDSGFHALEPGTPCRTEPVAIGDNAWISRGAITLPAVTVGQGAVVGAASVVVRDVPAVTLVAGNPATVVRRLRAEPGWRRP